MSKKVFYLTLATITLSATLFIKWKVDSKNESFSSSSIPYSVFYNNFAPSDVGFASEKTPLNDEKFTKRLKKLRKYHSYEYTKSYKIHQKARQWFPIIESILKKNGIPKDFKYLPIVESGLKHRRSRKGALGYWQLMPNTARSYGLIVNRYCDERLNVVKATEASSKYIKHLYREFGSWTLAAAAFNLGETSLRKHLRQQKNKDYYTLKMNRETAMYLYKVLSIKSIIENPVQYGYQNTHQINSLPVPFEDLF